jgi:orotate phosphoribosyltransferase
MEFTFQVATRMPRSYPAAPTPSQCAAVSCGRPWWPTGSEGGAFPPFPHRIGDVTDARQQLIDYISAEAVFHGDFTLTSGKKATYYVDLRKVSLDHRVAPLIGQIMIDLIREVPDVFAVGGMTMGADPVAAAILHQGAARGLSYDAFVVRKEPKDHGRGKQVEGPDLEGKRVIVLEDTSTTGGSPLKAIEALEKIGAVVAGVAVVVDRSTGAREVIEAAGYPYFAAIGLKDLGLD